MILERLPGPSGTEPQIRVVTQNDHAALSADLLELLPALDGHPHRAALSRAARQHDNGWQETDAVPLTDDAGRPYGFLELPNSERLEIWRRGVARLEQDPPVAALVAEHALYVLKRSEPAEALRQLFEWLEGRISEALGVLDWSREALKTLHGWLRVVDALSLHASGAWGDRTATVTGVPAGNEKVDEDVSATTGLADLRVQRVAFGRVLVEPLPLVAPTRCVLRFRTIPDRSYASAPDLVSELALSRWQSHDILFTDPQSDNS